MLPFLALTTSGAAALSLVGSAAGQNYLAKYLYEDIPRGAKPYPNFIEYTNKHPHTNSSLPGFMACGAVTGAAFVAFRIPMTPLLNALRKRYIYLPGTNFPRRINNIQQFLYDLQPDVVVNSIPLALAFPLGFAAKVYVEGAGRFTGFSKRYNPYTLVRETYDELYFHDMDKYVERVRGSSDAAAAAPTSH